VPTPGLSCSLAWLCFRSSPVWCKKPKNNEFRTKKFLNQGFLYGISSFCTLSENNSFLWMATGAVPVRIRTATHFSSENSHRETLHRGRMSRPPWAFVRFTTALRYESCTQFINVSQRTLHIYFIDGCRRIKIERNNLLCEQAPTEVFRSIFAWLVTFKLK
jgi:hypothetical protein